MILQQFSVKKFDGEEWEGKAKVGRDYSGNI